MASLPAGLPTNPPGGQYDVTVTPRAIFTNQSAGNHTYYLNAFMGSGADNSDVFWYGGVTAQVLPNG